VGGVFSLPFQDPAKSFDRGGVKLEGIMDDPPQVELWSAYVKSMEYFRETAAVLRAC
jgi:hypothetical protein